MRNCYKIIKSYVTKVVATVFIEFIARCDNNNK